MRGPNRERRRGRRAPFRDPRPIILIVCEGARTERQYFEKFALHHQNARIKVRVSNKTGVPLTLVRAAKEHKDESEDAARRQRDQNLAFDSVWCVFDIDEHPHIHEAREMAVSNGIDLAISNPCFELWLVLHHRESPGMTHRQDMQALLRNFIADYDKHVDFNRYTTGYPDAVARARRLDTLALQVGEPGRNPTSNVYRLTELILKGKEDEEP
jgi:hypothetical protein